jgi:hypothetical protein
MATKYLYLTFQIESRAGTCCWFYSETIPLTLLIAHPPNFPTLHRDILLMSFWTSGFLLGQDRQ